MTKNEIKEQLYKEKPNATLRYICRGVAYYIAVLMDTIVEFEVPVSDMGDADFEYMMDAKLLCRWIEYWRDL